MNDKQLESFLRENRPETASDPTFILETRRRMEQVEGIKSEVDRTRRGGRVALILPPAFRSLSRPSSPRSSQASAINLFFA